MSIVVAIHGWSPDQWVRALSARAPDRRIEVVPHVADVAAVHYALVWKPEAGLLRKFPNLKAIFSLGAGVDHLTSDPELPDLPVVRIVDPYLTARMTEWVVLQVLLHHRQQRAYDGFQAQKRWQPLRQWAAQDVRVGIMGLGELGRESARALLALGFDVAGWSRRAKALAGIACFHGESGLASFLARTDILVVLLPLTEATRGVIDTTLLDGLARDGRLGGPVLINAGRGGLQKEADIDAALRSGRLKAASLDVFAEEPLPPESPLWTAPNLTITPHVAAESDPVALSAYVMSQIKAFEAGKPLQNLVDRTLGY